MTTSPFSPAQLAEIRRVAGNYGILELQSNKGAFLDANTKLMISSEPSEEHKGLPKVGLFDGVTINESPKKSLKMLDDIREDIKTAFKALPKKKFEPKVAHDSAKDGPECSNLKIGIEGTKENIKKAMKEINEKLPGLVEEEKKDEPKTETKTDKTPEKPSVKEQVKPKPAKMCGVCGTELPPKRAMECFEKDPQEPRFICEDCEAKKPEPEEAEVMPANKQKADPARIPMRSITPQGSMIKGFVPSLKEIGKIKIGKKGEKTTGSGYRLPVKFDHFEVVSLMRNDNGDFIQDEIMKSLSESPKTLNIMLLFNDPTLNFITSYGQYQGGKCVCRGDGVSAKLADGSTVECNPETCVQAIQKKCKPNGILSVILTDSPRLGGVYKFRTTSFHSIRSILSSMFFLSNLTGGVLAMIPLKLTVAPQQAHPDPTKPPVTIYVVNIEFAGTAPELLQKTFEVQKYQMAMKDNIMRLETTARQVLTAPETPEEQKEVQEEWYPDQTEATK